MKSKFVIIIFIFIAISFMFVNKVYADNEYYEIAKESGEVIKIDKNKINNAKDKEEIKALVQQVYWIDSSTLTTGGVKELYQLLGNFYLGAYKNLDDGDSYKDSVYTMLFKYTPGSTAYKLARQAEKKQVGLVYQNQSEYNNLETIKKNLESGKFIPTGNVQPPSSAAAGQGGDKTTDKTDEKKEEEGNETSIYRLPKKQASTDSKDSLDDMIWDAETFVAQGTEQKYSDSALQSFSTTLYNILLTVGVAIALITGIIIGIKYMMASVEEKANYKQMLVPYLIGCFVVFGAFGIWKLVVTILENV